MTRKVVETQPSSTTQPRSATSLEGNIGRPDNGIKERVASRQESNLGPLHPNSSYLAQQFMYHFGGEASDLAFYSASPALLPELHFTKPAEHHDDDQPPEDLWSAYVAEEFATCGDLGEFPSSFTKQTIVEATNNLEPAWHNSATSLHVPVWPQQNMHVSNHYSNPLTTQTSQQTTFSPHFGRPLPIRQVWDCSQTSGSTARTPRQRFLLPKNRAPPDAPPDAGDVDEVFNGRGRKRALTPIAKDSARRVRLMGACARCHVMKEKCDDKRPCRPCLSKSKRTLDFFCMNELPETRHEHLFTEDMYGHLDLKNGEFFHKMPGPDPSPENKPFLIRLHQYFDVPELTIPVIRFEAKRPQDIQKSVFPITSQGQGFEVQAQEILSPPLVPAMNTSNLVPYINEFRLWVRQWLECAEAHDDLDWHLTFFREEYGKPWPRSVFADVCQFYHKVVLGRCPALKNALQSTVLVYMLGHSFYLPHEEIEPVLQRTGLADRYNGEFMYVSPIHVDRFLKALLFQFFKATTRATFKYYQDLCSPNKFTKLSRDRLLATSIVLIIVAGSQQSKAVEKAVARHRRGQQVDKDEVYKQIQEIEDYINDLIIELWRYKFEGPRKWDKDDSRNRVRAHAAKQFDLMGRFKSSYQPFANDLEGLSTELPSDINDRKFGIQNIDRLLKKFYLAVFPTDVVPDPDDKVKT